MKSYSAAVALAGFISSTAAHGFLASPAPRMPGNGLKAACGDQVYYQQSADHFGNVQAALQNLQGDHPNCRMWHCKGVPFADAGEIFSYTAGQVIPMNVTIRAPHDGVANVSIVKISSDTVIGPPLISWDKYALTSSPMSAHPEWTSFDIKMPDVRRECAKAGDCVIQWYWNAPTINQTYESCIDFQMGGGSNSSSTPAAPRVRYAASPSSGTPAAASPVSKTESGAGFDTGLGAAESSDSELPKTFTLDTFITWLKANAGPKAASKLRRMVVARDTHPRAFRE